MQILHSTSVNRAMSSIGNSLTSTIRVDRGQPFGKARDRFYSPAAIKPGPSPNTYSIPSTVGYDERKRSQPYTASRQRRTVFGKEDRSKLFLKQLVARAAIETPELGPGSYAHYTDFNNDEKFSRSLNWKTNKYKT